ncbi:unnamed protein product [Blepharisma stoltei]|uniref:WDR59/RTC1-like RING zinc finger domain-containing protein n=1 Tax=Blepharisma stoltei TaxID=1481888 RepID=A0AAU9IWL4_9CILI|nr:unnamed protein product [Blepharisma stoltei]
MTTVTLNEAYSIVAVYKDQIAVGGTNGISIVDLQGQQEHLSDIETQNLSWSKDGLLAASRGKVLDVYKGKELIWSVTKHIRNIRDIKWNDANLITSCSTDSKLFAWDIRTKEPAITFNATKGVGVYRLAWSHHSSDILASAHDTALKLWDARLPRKSLATVKAAHPGRILCLDWHHTDSSKLLSSGVLSYIKVWKSSSTNVSVLNSAQYHPPIVKTLFTPSSNRIVCVTEQSEGKLHILDADDLRPKLYYNLRSASIEDVAWGENKLIVLSADRVLNVIEGQALIEEKIKEDEDSAEEEFEGEVSNLYIEEKGSISLEEELNKAEKKFRGQGMNIEDKGMGQRYCVVRISNERNYIRYLFKFPQDYPKSPPILTLQGFSIDVKEHIKSIEKKTLKISTNRSKNSQNSFIKLCDYILKSINKISPPPEMLFDGLEADIVQDEEDIIENTYRSALISSCPASSGHCWHPSGKLFTFICYRPTEQNTDENENTTDDFFEDIKAQHFEMGINAEELNPAQNNENNQNLGILLWADYSWLLPYTPVFVKELSMDPAENLINICKKNASVCEKYGHAEVAKCWELFIPSLELFVNVRSWVSHPLGLSLAAKFLSHFCQTSNITGRLMICLFCILALKTTNSEACSIKRSITISSSDQSSPESIENYYKRTPCRYLIFLTLKEFSEILLSWGMQSTAIKILKMMNVLSLNNMLLSGEESLGFNMIHPKTTHLQVNCNKCNTKFLKCSICLKAVLGLSVFCEICGHGGHLIHQKQWFSNEAKCASGCGCSCVFRNST